MSDDCLPKQLLYGELCYGKRSLGGKKKRFKDTLKNTLTGFNIDVTNWEACALDRSLWRSKIHTWARTAETNRRLRKSALLAKRDFTLPPALQPARHTHAPSVEECCRSELDWLATSAPTGPTKHDTIIIIEEVMVIIGNDGRTTCVQYYSCFSII